MADWVWWFVLAGAALVAELLTGTFYLLVIAAALAATHSIARIIRSAFTAQLLQSPYYSLNPCDGRPRQQKVSSDPVSAVWVPRAT